MATEIPQETQNLAQMIVDRIGGDIPPMRILKATWFPRVSSADGMAQLAAAHLETERKSILASMKPTVIKVGEKEPCPFDPTAYVSSIFEDEDELRVYCIGQEPARLECFRLNKSAPTWTMMDFFQLSAFADAIADEMVELRDSVSSAEAERAAIVQYGEEVNGDPAQPYSLTEFLDDVKEGVHLVDDEEEEPEEPEAPKLAAVPSAPS